MSLLTKAAKGVAYGDVSNAAVRNILAEISNKVYGRFTEQEMIDTLDYFDWKCPYTGKDLRNAIKNGTGGYVTDHIYPQNKEYCGLNVKGNLVIVDKAANGEKGTKSIKEFFNNEKSNVLRGVDKETREARLKKIEDFKKACGYDPEDMRKKLMPLLEKRYSEIRVEQEKSIADAISATGMKELVAKTSTLPSKTRRNRTLPDIVLFPENECDFKQELLKKKSATFILTYDSGAVKTSTWNAEKFNSDSNLKNNIHSRPFWRNKDKDGLIRVEVRI